MRFKLCVLGIFLLSAGCASTKAIDQNYQRLVDVSNGVNEEEAKIMAQKEIIATYEQQAYRVTAPDIRNSIEAKKYPDVWFVTFGHNWLSPLSMDTMAKTYSELKETIYVVAIDKKTGKVLFSGEWYPKRDAGFDWVFNRDEYRAQNPLALSPYSEGHKIGTGL